MAKYVLDTNIYIHAVRDLAWNHALEAFADSKRPFLYLHSTVAGELTAGAITPAQKRVAAKVIGPFEATDRIITPTHTAWKRAGEIVAELVRTRVLSPNGIPRSFLNDCLIAASVREAGITLVTDNAKDFQAIRNVFECEVVPPWP